MFTAKLFDFQTKHEESLLVKCADHEELVLSAPTGAGKTVLVSKFIDDYPDENPNAVFLWLCLGAGGLDKQSQDSFREVTSGIPDGDVYAFINESDPQGKVFFINWGKINRSSNVVLREGEYRDLIGKVMFCHTNGIDIFMLIDEDNKLIDGLSLREYNVFLVNNRERLIEVFSGVSADRIAEIEETDIISAEWYIPREQYYSISTKIMGKNLFVDYGNNILIQPSRTFTEISFGLVRTLRSCEVVL